MYITYFNENKRRVPKVPQNTAWITVWVRVYPWRVTVCAGSGTVWENPTRGIPVFNPNCMHIPEEPASQLHMNMSREHEWQQQRIAALKPFNVSTSRDLSCMILLRIKLLVMECRILGGDGKTVFIPRISINASEGHMHIHLSCCQFAVCLAFAMTINKSQGQSAKCWNWPQNFCFFTWSALCCSILMHVCK